MNKKEKQFFSVMNKIVKAKQKVKNLRIEKWVLDINVKTLNMPFTNIVKHSQDFIDDKIEIIEAKAETLIDKYEETKPEFLTDLKNSNLDNDTSNYYRNEIKNFENFVLN